MILYIQPIFVSDHLRLEQNKKSIISIANYLKKYPHDVRFVLGGWAYNDDLWNSIKNTINEHIPKNKILILKRFDKNYGKAYVVNSLYKLKGNVNFKYFLTCDSDIIFSQDCPNVFPRLIDVANKSRNHTNKNFGYISLNQKQGCCHLHHALDVKYTIINRYSEKETLSYSRKANGIAGGCLFINRELWERIGGYKILGVYAGEDGAFLRDTYKSGYSFQVSNDIFIIHPHSPDKEYSEMKWKIAHNKELNNRNNGDPILHNKVINFMNNYWKNKNKND